MTFEFLPLLFGLLGAVGGAAALALYIHWIIRPRRELNRKLSPFGARGLLPRLLRTVASPEPFEGKHSRTPRFEMLDREESYNCLNRLTGKVDVLVRGRPASGKSTLLLWVASKLIGQGKKTYIIDLKSGHKMSPGLASEIRKGYLLLDDVHLDLEYTEAILRAKTVPCLLATNEVHPLEYNELPFLRALSESQIVIEAETVAHSIVRHRLAYLSEEDLRDAVHKLSAFMDDLWVLTMSIDALEGSGTVQVSDLVDAVVEKITDWLPRRGPLPDNIEWQDFLLPLAIFGAFEIKTERSFHSDVFGISADAVMHAERMGELVIDHDKALLAHRSVSQLYLVAFISNDSLGHKAKEQIRRFALEGTGQTIGDGKYDWFHLTIGAYLIQKPEEMIYLVRQLHSWRMYVTTQFKQLARGLSSDLVRYLEGLLEEQLMTCDFDDLALLMDSFRGSNPELLESVLTKAGDDLLGRMKEASQDGVYYFFTGLLQMEDSPVRSSALDRFIKFVRDDIPSTKVLDMAGVLLEAAVDLDPEFSHRLVREVGYESWAKIWTAVKHLDSVCELVEMLYSCGPEHLNAFLRSTVLDEAVALIRQSSSTAADWMLPMLLKPEIAQTQTRDTLVAELRMLE